MTVTSRLAGVSRRVILADPLILISYIKFYICMNDSLPGIRLALRRRSEVIIGRETGVVSSCRRIEATC